MFTEHERINKTNKMILSESEIAKRALRNLEANTGISGYWVVQHSSNESEIDGKTTLTLGENTVTFKTEVKREFREYQLEKLLHLAELNKPFMLIAEKIFPNQKQSLREHGIAYLDASGNIYASNDNLLLWLDGQKPIFVENNNKTNRAFTKAGLKLVYAFLQNPEAANYTYRELARFAKVSLGTIKEAMSALKDAGYILKVNKNRLILTKKKELLENWIIGYKNILKPSLLLGTYHFGMNDSWNQIELPATAIWGGEPAGDLETGYLKPENWTIYSSQAIQELIKKLRLAPKSEGKLKIYGKFWHDVDNGSNIRVTPDLITYADLIITGEVRCIETANIIYEKKLSHIFDQP